MVSRSRSTISSVTVLFILAALVLQYAYSVVFGEPYPAIRYPSFHQVYGGNGYIDVEEPEAIVCRGRDVQPVDLEVLLAPFPQSFIPKALESIGRNAVEVAGTSPTLRVIDARSTRADGGGSGPRAALVTWIREKIESTYGVSGHESEMVVRWHRRRLPTSDTRAVTATRLTKTLYVDLRDQAAAHDRSTCLEASS